MVSKREEDSQDLITDRDLELAAIFGKILLDKNKELSDKIGYLEEELMTKNDQVNRLRQRILVKNKLLKIYSQDIEEMEVQYDSLVKMQRSSDICQTSLRRKCKILEDTNQQLELETFRLASLITDLEIHEDKFGKDFLEKLSKIGARAETLVADLTDKTSENSKQEKTIQSLLSKIEKIQRENADLCSERTINQRTTQRMESSLQEVKKEVINWKDQYDELVHFMEGIQGQFTPFHSWYKPKLRVIENVSIATELEQYNRTKNEFPYLHGSTYDDQITDECWYRDTPYGESGSEHIAASTHSVEKEKEKEEKNECPLFDNVDEKCSETEKAKELVHLKQCSEPHSGSFDRLTEQSPSCKHNMTVKQNAVNSYVPSNMGNCYPKLFRKLKMVKLMEGSAILRQWQQLAVQQKGFGFSPDSYSVLESCVD